MSEFHSPSSGIQDTTPRFIEAAKTNTNHQSGHELQHCLEQLKVIMGAGVDFLESAETYETPTVSTS